MGRIGYDFLSDEEKRIYERYEKVVLSHGTVLDGISIPRNVDVMKVLRTVLGDHPEIVYFHKGKLRSTSTLLLGQHYTLTGVLPPSKIRTVEQELQNALTAAVDEIMLLNPMTDYDKLMCAYEYLQDHVTYDDEEFEAVCRKGNGRNMFSHNAYGALVQHKAVCDGIAAGLALLLQGLGIDATCIGGQALFQTSSFSNHGWNLIRLGQKYYHIDATWDINHKEVSGEYSYEYFCVSDDTVKMDHQWDAGSTPACNYEDLSFYVRNKCFANTLTQFEDIVMRIAKSKQSMIRIKLAEGISIPEPVTENLGKLVLKGLTAAGRQSRIQYQWSESTRCFYAKLTT